MVGATLVKAFQPRVEGLMQKLQALAATLEKDGATKKTWTPESRAV